MKSRQSPRSGALAFLLAQVGAHASQRFAERIAALGVTPPQVGILRALAAASGMSQQRLASLLGIHPSRLVGLVDELEAHAWAERRDSPDDRRSHALQLTAAGRSLLEEVARLAAKHEDELCASLAAKERERLTELLERIAHAQGLAPGVHPGYSRLGKKPSGAAGA